MCPSLFLKKNLFEISLILLCAVLVISKYYELTNLTINITENYDRIILKCARDQCV